jgi:hypothetical protein
VSYPITIICGNAGSGKDTLASYMVKRGKQLGQNIGTIAQAAPLKDFGKTVFGFSDEQLYGPSQCRNGHDPRYDTDTAWNVAYGRMVANPQFATLFCTGALLISETEMRAKLSDWFTYYCSKFKGCVTPRNMLQQLGTEFGRALGEDIWSNIAIATAMKMLKNDCSMVIITDGRFRNEVLNVKKWGGTAVHICDINATEQASGHRSEVELASIPSSWYDVLVRNNKTRGLAHIERHAAEVLATINSNVGIPPIWAQD